MNSRASHGIALAAFVTFAIAASAGAQTSGKTMLKVDAWQETELGMAEICLPLAQGELKDAASARAVDAGGRELPMQVRVLNVWPQDKSMRVLWLTVKAQKKPFSVEFGPGVKRTEVASRIAVKQDADETTIENGMLKLRIPAKQFRLFAQVWLGGQELLKGEGAITTLTTLDGKRYVPTNAPPEISIETAGGLYATVCVKGAIAPADNRTPVVEECFQVTYRIKVWADSPIVQVQHVLARAGQPFTLAAPSVAAVKKEWTLLVPVKSDGIELTLAGNAVDFSAGGDGKELQSGHLVEGASKLIVAGGDFEKNAPTIRSGEDGAPQPGALRYLDVSNGKVGVAVAVRDAAEIFPKACEVSGRGTVRVDLWHDSLPYAVLEIGSGYHRAHDIVFNFHAGKADAANGEKAVRSTLPSYAAVPSAQFRKSRVFSLMPGSMDGFPEFAKLYASLNRGPGRPKFGDTAYGMAFRASPMPKMFGRMQVFGGDISNPMSVQSEYFALTGDRKVLEAVDQNGRWTRDWNMKWRLLEEKGTEIVEFPEPSNTLILYRDMLETREPGMKELAATYKAEFAKNERRIGMNSMASLSVCRTSPCFRSNKSAQFEGVLYHYFLTGDTESLEGAKRYGNFYCELMTNPKWYGNPNHNFYTKGGENNKHRFHIFGPWMDYLAYFYEGTDETKYLDAMKSCMMNIMKGANFEKFPDDDFIFWRGWIANVDFVCRNTARFSRAMYEYHRLTGDDSIKKFAVKIGDGYLANFWDPKRNEFFWRPPLKTVTVPESNMDDAKRNYWGMDNMYICTSLSYIYLVTGDRKYLDCIERLYPRCVQIAAERSAAKPPALRFSWADGVDMDFENFWVNYYVLEKAKGKP